MKITAFKMTELGPIPSDWEVKRLGEVCEINPSSSRQIPDNFVYIDLESVVSGHLVLEKKISHTLAPSRAQRLFSRGDVLYQTVRPYQRNNLFVDFDASGYVASTGYAVLHSVNSVSDSSYIFQQIHFPSFVSQVLDNCTGTSYPAINPHKLGEIIIPLPPLPEQHRIAAALSDMDELIGALGKLVEKKRAIKTGAMQRLLTGQTRLPGFGGKWEEKRLGDWGMLIRETENPTEFPDKLFVEYSMPAFDAGKTPQIVIGKSMLSSRTKIHGEVLLFNKLNVRQRRIWHVELCADNAICSSEFLPYYSDTIDLRLLAYALDTEQSTKHFIDVSKGTSNSQKRISPQDFEDYRVILPPTLPEQRAIAAVLSDMDAEIAALEAEQAKYTRIKSGMMQELLTGKTRLN